jgi:hypothetical protein
MLASVLEGGHLDFTDVEWRQIWQNDLHPDSRPRDYEESASIIRDVNLSWIENFEKFRPKYVRTNARISQVTLEKISDSSQVERIYLPWTYVNSLTPVAKWSRLTHLLLGTSNRLESFRPLSEISTLVSLGLWGSFRLLDDLSFLGNMPQLQGLLICGPDGGPSKYQRYQSLAPIASLEELRYLSIANSHITEGTLDFLKSLNRLEFLHITNVIPWKEAELRSELLSIVKEIRNHGDA